MIDGNLAMANALEIEPEFCHICGKIAIAICESCEEPYCEDCRAEYNQFTQIDYDCCSSCAENRSE